MHGTEHCNRERRAFRLSAPRWPFSPASGSMLPGSPQLLSRPGPVARNGLSLACNGCPLSAASIPGSKFPACYFASLPAASAARSASRLRYRDPVCPGSGRFIASGPLQLPRPGSTAASPDLHSPSGLLHPSGSKRSTGFAASRPAFRIRPISFRSPLPRSITRVRLRIIVPGSLRFRRLAVPQTSWNLLHYAPDRLFRQCFLCVIRPLFLNIYFALFLMGYSDLHV